MTSVGDIDTEEYAMMATEGALSELGLREGGGNEKCDCYCCLLSFATIRARAPIGWLADSIG